MEDLRIAMYAEAEGLAQVLERLRAVSKTPAQAEQEIKNNRAWFKEHRRG